jgi:ABC-type multidrug transport system permease subunit
MFGFNPSVLPWWLWLIGVATSGFTWFQAGMHMSKKRGRWSFIGLLYYLFGGMAIVCVLFTLASLFKLFDR